MCPIGNLVPLESPFSIEEENFWIYEVTKEEWRTKSGEAGSNKKVKVRGPAHPLRKEFIKFVLIFEASEMGTLIGTFLEKNLHSSEDIEGLDRLLGRYREQGVTVHTIRRDESFTYDDGVDFFHINNRGGKKWTKEVEAAVEVIDIEGVVPVVRDELGA